MRDLGAAKERFDRKWTEDANGCHIWHGARLREGYGQFGFEGKRWLAHRWIFYYAYQEKPSVVCHKCDRPSCVNIDHLFGGTHRENLVDAIRKGRHRPPGSFPGGRNPRAKIGLSDVEWIRSAPSGMTQREMAEHLGITQTCVSSIITRKTWK